MKFRFWGIGLLTAVVCWYGMMATHEFGHAIGAWVSGGEGMKVSLPIFGFSQTTVAHNPYPLIEVWAGPMLGDVFAAMVLGITVLIKRLRGFGYAFAGFCLITNGVYIGLGWIESIFQGAGDAGDLIRDGAKVWQRVGFGVISSLSGLWVWHVGIEKSRANSSKAHNLTSEKEKREIELTESGSQ